MQWSGYYVLGWVLWVVWLVCACASASVAWRGWCGLILEAVVEGLPVVIFKNQYNKQNDVLVMRAHTLRVLVDIFFKI
jgi:hypothetical protein